jgi:predicted MFS family arabinose efflux permease
VSVGGAAIGLLAGGLLVEFLSWRWVMFVNVPIGVAVLLAAAAVVPETQRQPGRFDVPGAITSTVGMSALVYGFVHAADAGWRDPVTVTAFTAGVMLIWTFVAVERRAPAPITPLGLFASRTRSGAYVARLLMFAGMMGMFFFLTQFLQGALGYSPIRTGLAFLPLTIALFVSSQASARFLVERIGDRPVMLGGAVLSLLSLLWLTQLSATSGYLDVLGPLLVLGLGNGSAFVPLTSAGLAGVEPHEAGAASGLVNVAQQLGGSLGLAVLVTVFGTASRNTAQAAESGASRVDVTTQAFVSGADAAFLAAAALLAVTVVVVGVMLGRRSQVSAA